MSKSDIKEKIEHYFTRLDLPAEETKKIRKLALQHRIPLTIHKKLFCKRCYANLRRAKIRVSREHKIIACSFCKTISKIRIS
jgi:RNase P subunit RPR2